MALGNKVRWPALKLLADGRALTATQMAAALGRDPDATGKNLRQMRAAGLIESPPGDDRRQTLYQIPAARRPRRDRLRFLCD